MANSNIETAIMSALGTMFTTELIAAYSTSDPLRLRRLIAAPLQDDPTTSAPYLIYGPAYALGRGYSAEDIAEVGGNILWQTAFQAVIGTPRAQDRNTAYTYIAELSNRAEHAVLKHFDLSGINGPGQCQSADGSEWIDAIDPTRMWGSTRSRIYGGDGEFYGEAILTWQYNYYRLAPWFN